jgi:putative tryptophan/tyrosine transport system substrate-binding protein
MRRREFITIMGGATLAWPLAARAQQPAMPLIGWLNAGTAAGYANMIAALQQGLKELGYVVGDNVAIEYRWADGRYDRLPELAADLVRRRVAVIAANLPAATAAKAATTTIPIVFSSGADPIGAGIVTSLSRPGGNVTGVTSLAVELGPKRLALLHELLPNATVVAALLNPSNSNAERQSKELQTAAAALGLQLHVLPTSGERDFEAAFATAARLRAAALVISADPLFNAWSERLATLAVQHRIPASYQYREFAAAGGLMSYGTSITDMYRLVGTYTGRILKGAKPADLPVQQSTKIELVINLKTAEALGLTVPPTLRALANEVIE